MPYIDSCIPDSGGAIKLLSVARKLLPFSLVVLAENLRYLDETVGSAGRAFLDTLETVVANVGINAVTTIDSLNSFDRTG